MRLFCVTTSRRKAGDIYSAMTCAASLFIEHLKSLRCAVICVCRLACYLAIIQQRLRSILRTTGVSRPCGSAAH